LEVYESRVLSSKVGPEKNKEEEEDVENYTERRF